MSKPSINLYACFEDILCIFSQDTNPLQAYQPRNLGEKSSDISGDKLKSSEICDISDNVKLPPINYLGSVYYKISRTYIIYIYIYGLAQRIVTPKKNVLMDFFMIHFFNVKCRYFKPTVHYFLFNMRRTFLKACFCFFKIWIKG